MKTPILAALSVLLLASCSAGIGSGATTPAQAQADNTTFLENLPAAARQTALFCQVQFQNQLGGKVYVIAAPSLQSGDIQANTTTTDMTSSVVMVYDRVADGKVTSAGRPCQLHSQNLVVHPSHAE